MSVSQIAEPFELFHDIDGQPLEDGYIYVGQTGVDPITNPIDVYSDSDLMIPIAQPIRTTGGYPVLAGTPTKLYVSATAYSITVINKRGTLIYTDLMATTIGADNTISFTSLQNAANYNLSQLNSVRTISFYDGWQGTLAGPKGGALYARDGSTGTPSTIYSDNSGFYDANGDGFKISVPIIFVSQLGGRGIDAGVDSLAVQTACDLGEDGPLVVIDATYLITTQIQIRSNSSVKFDGWLKAGGPAIAPTFYSLIEPEDNAVNFNVFNMQLDCDNQLGVNGFQVGVGSHSGQFIGGTVKNFSHDKAGVKGGRGFIVESIATAADMGQIRIDGITIESGYMAFAIQGGDGVQFRPNVIVTNLTIKDCDVVYWLLGNTTGYPHNPESISGIISNITAYNCGAENLYTNGGGAFCSERGGNFIQSNVSLVNDASYGSITNLWHGNGSKLAADITYYGDCINFWNYQAYFENDSPSAVSNTVEDSEFNGRLHGSCTDLAVIGSATDSFAEKIRISGRYKQVTSSRILSGNLGQDDIWVDVYEDTNNCRVIGEGSTILSSLFSAAPSALCVYGDLRQGNSAASSYSPTATTRDSSSVLTEGGHEVIAFYPHTIWHDLSGGAHSASFGANGNQAIIAIDPTPATPAWVDVARFDLNSTAGNTRFMIYDVDNGTVERVSVGAADSGGAGFKLLRIPN